MCCEEVLWRSVADNCCKGLRGSSVVEKRRQEVKACWGKFLWRSFVKKSCGEVMSRNVVLQRSVVESCCNGELWRWVAGQKVFCIPATLLYNKYFSASQHHNTSC